MATPTLRLPENAAGRYYVTSECIDCDQCREIAPEIYQRNAAIGFTVVIRQPSTETERQMALEGLRSCPVEAIGCEET